MTRLFTALSIVLLSFQVFGTQKVYLLHGFGNSRAMMRQIDKELTLEQLDTENVRYRSMVYNLDTLGKQLYLKIKASEADTVSFVTFSMGALVVRSMLQYTSTDTAFPVIYRMVMIAPPNQGAEVADFYSSYKVFNAILGPNVQLMRTDTSSYVHKLPVPQNAEVGIIIGAKGKEHGYNLFIHGDNDGFLSPERARLGVEKEQIVVKCDHATITRKKITKKLVSEFLHQGTFATNNHAGTSNKPT